MVDAPEKIWADNDGGWHSNDCSEVLPCTEFVRADIAEREKEELRKERDGKEEERAEQWRLRRDAEGSRDVCKAACDTMRFERDEALRQLAERDADLARVRAALEGACEQILDSYRTWVADDTKAHPRPGQIPRYDRARAALAGSGDGWRSMESAPRDGTAIWLLVDGHPMIGYGEEASEWGPSRFVAKAGTRAREAGVPDEIYGTSFKADPTGWTPLPASPSTAGER